MYLKKEFSDLIINHQKQYEFRNVDGLNGYYHFKNKQYFKLELVKHFEVKPPYHNCFSITQTQGITKYYFFDYEITKQEYEWYIEIMQNYFNYSGVYVYKWTPVACNACAAYQWKHITLLS